MAAQDGELRRRYERLLGAIAAGEHADLVSAARLVSIPGSVRPWTDTGIDLARGDRLSVLAEGRLVLSEELDLWLPPRLSLWRRIGEKGPIFKAARDTATHTAATVGRLQLACNPSQWTTPEGDYAGAGGEFTGTPGGYQALLIRWRGDPRQGLRALQRHAPDDPLLAAEIARLEAPPVARPEGFDPLWFVGESDVFSAQEDGDRKLIRARPVNEAAILKKEIACDLTPQTRLSWRWKFDRLPARVAEDQLATHDYISIAVEFENGQDLSYFWSAALPEETVFRCPLPWWRERETHIAIRSGRDGLGRWLAEERDLEGDYRRAVGAPPARIVGVWLIAVSVFSHSEGVAHFSDIALANGGTRLAVY